MGGTSGRSSADEFVGLSSPPRGCIGINPVRFALGVGNSGLIHGYDPTRDRGDVDVAVMRNINPSMLEFYYLFVSNNY
jgi:hypothetical protein